MSGSSEAKPPLGGFDATTVGIGCMVGGGVFVVLPPVAGAAGLNMMLSLVLAAVVAYCSAASTFLLSEGLRDSGHAGSGGTARSAARVLLGPYMGFVTGWTLTCALLISAAVLALAFGRYAAPDAARPAAAAAVAVLAIPNLFGRYRGSWLIRFVLAFVLAVLAFGAVVAFNESGHRPALPTLVTDAPSTAGLLRAAGFSFFVFAGYTRLAALGNGVRSPERNIPRALPAAILVTLGLYLLVAQSLLDWFGSPQALAASAAPLLAPVAVVGEGIGTGAVLIAAWIASLSGLWALLEGSAHTAAAMAGDGDLPRVLGRTTAPRQVPWVAQAAAAVVVAGLVLTAELETLLGLAAFALLLHAGISNLCAFALRNRRWYTPRAVNLVGLVGALVLALSLPPLHVLMMLIVLVFGLVVRLTFRRPGQPGAAPAPDG